MGRRKERRLAAMAAAGRRVKLDLFLDDPSPGEASQKEGTGGENHDQQTVVPTSPSSSGKGNPLALLGQYSDDEEEDEKAADKTIDENKGSPRDASAKVTHEHGDTPGDTESAHTELSASVGEHKEAPQAGDVNFTSTSEENTVAPGPMMEIKSANAIEDIPDSGMQIVGDIGGHWKAVMHEQSNQCYYWNTVTGETSWEMPSGLTSGVASVPATHMDYSIEAQAHALPQNTLEVYPSEMSVGNGTSSYAAFGMECGSAQFTQDAYAYTASAMSHEDIDPLQLAKYGEDLLQRLNQLERLNGAVEGLELIRREIGIRISDCNALSSYGSSLLPLWLHAEMHLKQLESSISNLETSNCTDIGPICSKSEVAEHKAHSDVDIAVPISGEDLKLEASAGVTIGENVKINDLVPTSTQCSHDKDAEAIASKVETDNDEDMDVEMEVDDDDAEEQVNSDSVSKKEHPALEKVNSPGLSSSVGPAPDDSDVPSPPPPPPPEEEWIPPPPPDSDPAPPPSEEPVASYVHPDTIPQPYIGQANVGYALAGMEYYAAVGTEGTSATYYVHASEPHVLQAQQHSYYAPVSASGISVPVDGTSITQESYYTYPSVPTAAGVAAEHSGYYTTVVSAISSSAVDIKSSTSLVSANNNSDPAPIGSDKVISKDAGVPPLSQAVVATSATGTSMNGSSTQASTSTTNQTKVVRSKKRPVAVTTSLRSNKKVSSLVDKWKAAKDELREEEEEPENVLEALERKRQKEIEEWRKQQIASGEAKENANFVPVRGDWRDRVKRRRAEAKQDTKDESITASLSSAEHHKGQPDLTELSNGLPSGWQAYLDDSTKQVYYANELTLETTWIRPTK